MVPDDCFKILMKTFIMLKMVEMSHFWPKNNWCVARFGISHYLAFVWSYERMRMDPNNFFYLRVVFIRLHELAWKNVKR